MLAPIERALEKALESPIKKMKEFLGIHKETADSPSRKGLLKSLTGLIVTGLEEGLCDYGPPYEYDEYFDGALLFETSQPNCSASAVHGLLNCKVDPNDVDRDDLCFTPMHYCARHCHLIAMRMLIKAKAHVNVLNEFGQTPLIVCVMIEQSLNNQSTQLAMTEFLLDKGAYVDVRDKAGMSPLDYAAMHNNVELVKLLMDYGAKVMTVDKSPPARRDNEHFVVKRMPLGQTILDRTKDAEIYTLLKERLEEEVAEKEYKEAQERERKRKEEHERKMAFLREKNQREKEERLMRIERNKAEKLRAEVRAAKMRELQKKLAMEDALKALAEHKLGSWERDDHHRWRWQNRKIFHPVDHDHVYKESMKLVHEVRGKRSMKGLNARWQTVAGPHARIEAAWETNRAFDAIAGEDDAKRAASAGGPDASHTHQHEEGGRGRHEEDTMVVMPFDFKDDNDKELEGADLSDMVL